MSADLSPADPGFAFELSEPGDDGCVRLRLFGLLDAEAAPKLADEFDHCLEQGLMNLQIDMTLVRMISSAGVGSLIAGIGEIRDEGGHVVVEKYSPAVQHVFEMLDLLDFLHDEAVEV